MFKKNSGDYSLVYAIKSVKSFLEAGSAEFAESHAEHAIINWLLDERIDLATEFVRMLKEVNENIHLKMKSKFESELS